MFFRKLVALVFVFACGASYALAQDSFVQKIELTPFGGAKFGGKINVSGNTQLPTVDNLLIKSSVDYGAIFDYSLWQNFQIEGMWVRQPTTLSTSDTATIPPTVTPITKTALDTYTFGVAYSFRGENNLRPFIAGGMGWTNFTNVNNANGIFLGFHNRFAYNIGGGVKYYFFKYAGLRFDFRYLGTRTTPSLQCDQFGNCFQAHNHANQGEANLGLILRF